MSFSPVQPGAILAAALAIVAVTVPASQVQAKDGWLGGDKPGSKSLFYGELPPAGEPPNPENIAISLSCAKKGKAIVVFVSETDPKLKPGQKLRVILSAGGVNSVTQGRTLANQLAGVPSVKVTLSVKRRLFSGMNDKATLTIRAGGWLGSFPLKGIGNRLKTLLAACGK